MALVHYATLSIFHFTYISFKRLYKYLWFEMDVNWQACAAVQWMLCPLGLRASHMNENCELLNSIFGYHSLCRCFICVWVGFWLSEIRSEVKHSCVFKPWHTFCFCCASVCLLDFLQIFLYLSWLGRGMFKLVF